jgi:hypothetical protein
VRVLVKTEALRPVSYVLEDRRSQQARSSQTNRQSSLFFGYASVRTIDLHRPKKNPLYLPFRMSYYRSRTSTRIWSPELEHKEMLPSRPTL